MEKLDEIQKELEEQYLSLLYEVANLREVDETTKWKVERLKLLHDKLQDVAQISLKSEELKDDFIQRNADRELKSIELELRKMEVDLKEEENRLKEKQLKEEKKGRLLTAGVTTVGVFAPIVATWVWLKKTMKFEETGTFTTRGKNVIGDLFRLFKR